MEEAAALGSPAAVQALALAAKPGGAAATGLAFGQEVLMQAGQLAMAAAAGAVAALHYSRRHKRTPHGASPRR